MTRSAGTRKAFFILAALGATCGAAHADTVFTFTGAGNSQVVTTATYGPVYAGAYSGTLGGLPINVFCVDFNQEITTGDSYQATLSPLYNGNMTTTFETRLTSDSRPGYAPVNNLSNVSAQTRAGEVAYLADTFLPHAATENSTDLAAVGLSIWNIAQNGGGDSLLSSSDSNYTTLSSLVSGYEAQAMNHYTLDPTPGAQFIADSSGTNEQEYAYVPAESSPSVAAVPEPTGLIPMLLGAAGLGVLSYTRRRKTA